jgi:hypothetical protein
MAALTLQGWPKCSIQNSYPSFLWKKIYNGILAGALISDFLVGYDFDFAKDFWN